MSRASFDASPSKYVPRSWPIRPIALSRLRLVEQVRHERAQLAAVAEELLQRPRQPPVAVGEVRPERLLERGRCPLVRRLALLEEALELAPDDVDVDGHAGVLERHQADLERPLDERRAVLLGAVGDERGQGRDRRSRARSTTIRSPSIRTIVAGVGRRRERDDVAGFHGPILAGPRVT